MDKVIFLNFSEVWQIICYPDNQIIDISPKGSHSREGGEIRA
jgi:hypothetical protein